jgi:uncharacterized protein
MSISMHSASAAVFIRMLDNLLGWLNKAEAHAAAKKFDTAVLLSTRLAPDMLPFVKQVQIACDAAKFCMARLAGSEAPKFEDTESTLEELRQRVRMTIEYIGSVPATQVDGSEQRDIVVPSREGSFTLKGEDYLRHFAMPNFFFHVTTAYALLRHNGVDLGKADYLGLTRTQAKA